MRKVLLALGIVVALAVPAQASILSSMLTFDGTIDTINDNSRAMLLDNDADGILDPGDDIVGVLSIASINGDPVALSGGGIFGVFSLRVASPFRVGPGGTVLMDHIPVPAASANSLTSLLGAGGLTPPGGFANTSIFALMELPSLGSDDPLNIFGTTNTTNATPPLTQISNIFTTANGYVLDAVLGLTSSTDFFTTNFDAVTVNALVGNGILPVTIPEISADTDGDDVLSEFAGMTVDYSNMPGAIFLPVGVSNFGAAQTFHDVVLKPVGSIQTTSLVKWDVVDDSNFQLNVVPEPATCVVWLGLASLFGLAHFLRRKRA